MMSLRRIFGLMLLFLFFEAVVAVVTAFMFPQANVFLACLAMTGLAIATWSVFFLLMRLRSQRGAKQPAPSKAFVPAPLKTSPGDDSFSLEFSGLVTEANRRLQIISSSSEKHLAPSVATLPLYLVLGAEGSGKTTMMVNSGIEPRLLAGEAQKDGTVVPTATANLWYAEGAIFVEFAGRLLMQEPARWESALRILGQQSRPPWWKRILHGSHKAGADLRGVLIVCEVEALLRASDVRRAGSMARTLNERLQTLQATMRIDVPTYVLLTKCDAIPHFQEFFSSLSDAEGRRILGASMPGAAQTNDLASVYTELEGSRLNRLYNRLCQSIADMRMVFIAREESLEKRALAYEFPRELKKWRGEIVEVLLDIFRPSTLYPPFRFRGFYFSGKRLVPRTRPEITTGAGSSVDTSSFRRPMDATVIFSANRSSTLDFGINLKNSAETTTARWAFLTELFQQVILSDPAGRMAIPPPRLGDSKYVNLAFGAAGVVFLALSVVWVFSWQWNHRLLSDVHAAALETRVGSVQSPVEILPDLETLRPLMVRLHSYNRGAAPMSVHWGLYSGNRVANYLDRLYYSRFRQAILDPTVKAMSERFLQLQPSAPVTGDIYKELKSYRMITAGTCKADDVLVASAMLPAWSDAVSNDPRFVNLADNQIQFYSSELKIADPYNSRIAENAEAVQKAQLYLQDLSGPDKILQALLYQVREIPPERLSVYAGNYSQVLTGFDQVDGPYTRAGWNQVVDSIRNHKLVSSGEPCVVGGRNGLSSWTGDSTMDGQVQKLYSDSYIRSWKQFLETHHVIPFTSSSDAAQKLHILADNNNSPLLAVIYMTSANTSVAVPQSLRDRATDSVHTVASEASQAVSQAIGKISGSPNKPAAQPTYQPDQPQTVAAMFDSLHTVVDPGKRDKWLNEKNQPYITALAALSDALQSLPAQVHTELPLETGQLQQAKTAVSAADAALHSLEGSFSNTSPEIDSDLKRLLSEPVDFARKTVAAVELVKPPPVGSTKEGGGPPPPPDPKIAIALRTSISNVNAAALKLCSTEAALEPKFPFNSDSATDLSLSELDQLLKPGTGAYFQFSNWPDVSKSYNHSGRMWAAKPEFPATFSQPFLTTLNGFGEAEEELYGTGGESAHIALTIGVDGTGKIPFELEVDGHVIKFSPGHQTAPVQLVWPPLTNSAARLVIKNGSKKDAMQTGEWTGPWALFHLLQTADEQSGNVFIFRNVQFGHSLNPLRNDKGVPGTIQIIVTSAASKIFGRGYFSKLRCNQEWALQGLQTSAN